VVGMVFLLRGRDLRFCFPEKVLTGFSLLLLR